MQAKEDKKTRTKRPLRMSMVYIVVAVISVLIAVAGSIFVHSLRVQLYEQRAYSLGQTTEKIVQVMNRVIDNEWDKLEYASHELARDPQPTSAKLLERLDSFYQIDKKTWMLSCIDTDGKLYRYDGKPEQWSPSLADMLVPGMPNQQVTILEAPDGNAEQLAFLHTLPNPIRLTEENVVLTHTVLFLDMAALGESLDVSAFENKSYAYITEENGTRIYHQQNQNEFLRGFNILAALENADFLFDENYENLERAAKQQTPYAAEIKRGGTHYFVAYSPLSVNSWCLFLFVPEAYVGSNTAKFIGVLLLQVGAITLLLILLVTAFVWTNSRITLSKQKIAIDEAQRASKAKSDFLSHMSHDIRTPLNGIMGMCHIAEQKIGDDEAIADCLDKINLSSRQLMALINDVLDMSRIEQDKVDIRREPINLLELIRMCGIHIEVAVGEKGISFEKETDGIRHPLVFGDPVIIDKILTNILGNAAKFTQPGGKIRFVATETEDESGDKSVYRFEVADSGVGMKPEFMAHLFEPFSQENTGSRTKYQGTGLGLSIVKNLVAKLGGDIAVQSTSGEGSIFIVTLPLDYASETDFHTEDDSRPFDGTGLHALLVEDNELNCLIAQTILEERGLIVATASDGVEAVEKFATSAVGEYDFILMDVRMPVMDGLEASRQIRALSRADAATIPIIALSANALSEDMEKTREAGMNDHLGKPIDIDKLYAMLRKYSADKEN